MCKHIFLAKNHKIVCLGIDLQFQQWFSENAYATFNI